MPTSEDDIKGNSNENNTKKPANGFLSAMKQLMEEGSGHHPALSCIEEKRREILLGDIQWSDLPELKRFKHIKADTQDANEVIIRQFVWIAEVTTYILKHLARWIDEEISGDISSWYKTVINPFSLRLIPIEPYCRDLLLICLPARLPAFQGQFSEGYEKLKEMASKADFTHIRNFGESIKSFKSAACDFSEILLPIHSEAMLKLQGAKTGQGKPASGGGKTRQDENWHNDDYTEVRWNGRRYAFNKTQARVVEYLWANKRASEKSIGGHIDSDNEHYRLRHTFREKKGNKSKMHPAWGTMIVKDGKGIYALSEKKQKSPKK